MEETGGYFSGTVKPIRFTAHGYQLWPSWWSLVRFRRAICFFCFLEKLLFWGAQRCAARDLGGFEKAPDGSPLLGPGGGPQPQKPKAALLARKTARFACAVWALGGVFFWRVGRFEPLHVTQTSGNLALWASRALKYLKHHRTGRPNERFGGCAAKKSPFLPKRSEQAKKPPKRQKPVSSQSSSTVLSSASAATRRRTQRAAPALPAARALLQRGHPPKTATAMPMLPSRKPWWVCGGGGDTDARHLPISASSINRNQPKPVAQPNPNSHQPRQGKQVHTGGRPARKNRRPRIAAGQAMPAGASRYRGPVSDYKGQPALGSTWQAGVATTPNGP